MADESCTCFQGHAPCSYCERCSECQGCGKVFFDGDRNRDDVEIPVCPTCQDRYLRALELHQLDCRCEPCMAFVNADDAEAGFKAAIPIMMIEESRHGH